MLTLLLYAKLLLYKLLVYINPNEIYFISNLAIIQSQLKLYSDALWSYSLSILLDPDPSIFFNRGLTYYEMRKLNLAIEQFSEALSLNPNFFEAYYNRACVYQDKKMFELAILDYTEIITRNPSDYSSLFNRSSCYAYLGNFSSSISDLNTLISLHPFKEAYSLRGTCYYFLKNTSLALKDYYSARNLDSITYDCIDDQEIHLYFQNRLENLTKNKNTLQAINDLTSHITRKQQDSNLYFTRGFLNSQFPERLEEALQDFNTCLSYDSNNANAYFERAKLKAYLQDYVGCKKDMLKASTLDSSLLPYTCLWLFSRN